MLKLLRLGMVRDIDKWLRSSLPKLDIEKYLYRKA